MTKNNVIRAVLWGFGASIIMVSVYFLVMSLVTDIKGAWYQFISYWYFVIPLVIGFGIQVGLYRYLKHIIACCGKQKTVVAVSGTASSTAIVSCCSHHLVSVLPIIGASGAASILTQYQMYLFWTGIFIGISSITYISLKIILVKRKMGYLTYG